MQHEFIDAVNLLLKSGASDTILNKQLDAPLHIIVRMTVTNIELLTAVLQHHVELMSTLQFGRTALLLAALNGHTDTGSTWCRYTHIQDNVSGRCKVTPKLIAYITCKSHLCT